MTSMTDSLTAAFRSSRRLAVWIVVVGVIVYAVSGIYSVQNNEVAVHQRFGKVVEEHVPSGIHFALPWPIDRVEKVAIGKAHRLIIDDFLPGDDRDTAAGLFRLMTQLDSFCVTADNNVVNVGCAIWYRVIDPASFLFRSIQPETILRATACNSMVHCLAGMEVDRALTGGGLQLKEVIQTEMNRRLEALGSGITVVAVDLQPAVRPPQAVQSYFDDVVNAKIDARKAVSQAQADQNERVSRARVDATFSVEQARSHRSTVVDQAKGRAARFEQLLAEYRRSPTLTRRRLYIDFVREVLAGVPRKLVTESDASGKAPHMRLMMP